MQTVAGFALVNLSINYLAPLMMNQGDSTKEIKRSLTMAI